MAESPDRTRPRWLEAVVVAAAAALLITIGVAGGIGVEHHRQSSRADPRPSVTDVGFAQDMATHHEQALLLSKSLPASSDVEVRHLAQRIIDTQTPEIATLRAWLTWFGEPWTPPTPMTWMPADSSHHMPGTTADSGDHPPMPGMASVAEITRLTGMTGTAASNYFLQLMIRHHSGGVTMARAAFNAPDASAPVRQLAMSMIADQGAEIAQMKLLLAERGAAPL